ncbi:MAG: phospholipid carrier-dependent glycosyltransferase [Nitrospirae bacterium]|nr:phospholipid carrier-dependent glycosyltransferase [Nitrospirota bacterium]
MLLWVCAAFACVAVCSVKDDSIVVDETAHIPSGYAALKEQNFILNLEHPPLIKMIAAVPMLFQKINYSSYINSMAPADEWDEGYKFFYQNKTNFDTILFSGRIALIVFYTFFMFILGVLLKQVLSPAWLGVFFIAFEPNFLAHSRYITTDAGVTLFSVLSLVSFAVSLKKEGRVYIFMTVIFTGIALLCKFSGVLVYLCILFSFVSIELKHIFKRGSISTKFLKRFALIMAVPWVIVYLVYLVASWHVNPHQLNVLINNGTQTTELHKGTKTFLRPFVLYKIGLLHTLNRSKLKAESGHPQYLNGEVRINKGWWYYFPLALFYKETPILLVLLAAGLVFWLRSDKTEMLERILFFYSGVYFCISITSNLNIGIRHIQPMIAALTLMSVSVLCRQEFWKKLRQIPSCSQKHNEAARRKRRRRTFTYVEELLTRPTKLGNRMQLGISYLTVAVQLLSIVSVYPHYLAYFNVFAGGPANGYKYLADSNIDWGQDLSRLYLWAKKNKINSMVVHCWTETPSKYYDDGGIFKRSPEQLPADSVGTGWYLATSIASLQLRDPSQPPGLLGNKKPVAIIGHSILVYHFP